MSRYGRYTLAVLAIFVFCSEFAFSDSKSIYKDLSDSLVCKGNPGDAVYNLVNKGSNFDQGYAAHGFGEGTSYKAVVILRQPLVIADAETFAVVSETESSNYEFHAFTFARFKGDYRKVVKSLALVEANPFNEQSLGRYVSRQPPPTECPRTVALTPESDGYFLLGCGWCNG